MGTEPTSRGSPSGSASSFRKISKPLMEKKRRARINMSLEQLKSLLERHYSHQIRKRKLEKADILELSVKYMKSLQNSLQGLWPVPSGIDHLSGFQGCLPGVSPRLRRGEDGSGLRCPLVLERRAGSTMDSASPQAVSILRPSLPAIWAPASAAVPAVPVPFPWRSPRVLYRRSRTTTSVKLPNREPETRAWGVASLMPTAAGCWCRAGAPPLRGIECANVAASPQSQVPPIAAWHRPCKARHFRELRILYSEKTGAPDHIAPSEP
ncbi:hypothetical protein ACRRTK_016177 [Alexandromys fortis]